ncbi:MAG: lipopolysaccharide heptosyltransferase II [Ignavibacteriae bacterium]|nr:lipopolysaccharide heptosyltransferase II [Ignavibacteriota bacterium]
MMRNVDRILIVQTAFLGDVVLTLPLAQVLKEYFTSSKIDMLVVPRSADLIRTHSVLNEALVFDKYGADRGVRGFMRLVRRLKERQYGLAVVPHRSMRSALLTFLAGIPLRIGFDKSTGRILFNKTVRYRKDLHEVERNILLLKAIGIEHSARVLPRLYPSESDRMKVNAILDDLELPNTRNLIAVAPGTVWNTKRWLKERYAGLAGLLANEQFDVVLVGGKEDEGLCEDIRNMNTSSRIYNAAGKLSTLQSAELIRRCQLLVCNDSAPMHFAAAVGTPVVSIFGATVPEFGFAPYGKNDIIVETRGLKCRPCSKHGGDECPIKTFECMKNITEEIVFQKVIVALERSK